MFAFPHRCTTALVALLAVAVTASNAPAQYPYQNPYYPGYYNPSRAGGYLQGAAALQSSQGQLMIQAEQARIEREQANQAKLQTKKQTLDWQNYERANTPSYTDLQLKEEASRLRRMMNQPIEAEIVYGQVQNAMMPMLRQLANQGIQGPPVPLDPAMLQQINVTAGNIGNVGILRNGGQVDWPLPVRGPTQQRVASLLPQVVSQTAQNTLDPRLYKQVSDGVTAMQDDLRMQFRKEEIDGGTYLTGKRFLESLEKAVYALQQPGAAMLLNGTYAATGQTVGELVQNMSRKGLKFAPCSPGGEAAYHGLYNSMMSYAAGAQSEAGFRVQGAPQPSYGKQNPY